MGSANIREQDRSYRRGVVLGLTMAEIVLLLLFVVLLVLASALAETQADLQRRSDELAAARKEKDEVAEKLSKALLIIEEHQHQPNPASLVDKLTLCEKRDAELIQQIKKSEATVIAVKSAFNTAGLDSDKFNPDDLEAKLTEAVVLYSSIKSDKLNGDPSKPADRLGNIKAVAKQINELPAPYSVQTTDPASEPTTFEECKGRLSTMRGQYANLQKQAAAKGKGTEHPACWVDESGKADFIADVMLTETGFVVVDRKLSHRTAEQAKLPLGDVVWGSEVALQKFFQMTGPLLDWSKRQNPECRFFVRIFDQTLPGHKLLYKQRERQVQQVFYTYEPEPEIGGVQ